MENKEQTGLRQVGKMNNRKGLRQNGNMKNKKSGGRLDVVRGREEEQKEWRQCGKIINSQY